KKVIGPHDTFVVTNRLQRGMLAKQLPRIPEENIIDEPVGRNTAPCIGLAALFVRRISPTAVMVVSPADHIIQNDKEFQRILRIAIQTAEESNSLLTIGVQPTRPETGYGYIQTYNEEGDHNPYFSRGVLKVKTFAEKPNLQTAERFLASGDFLWNSGMFVWRADTILQHIEECLPDLYAELMKVDKAIGTARYQHALEKAYGVIRGISIDYGVMERSEGVYVIKGDFGWSDLGSWDEVCNQSGKDSRGNSITGSVIQKDTTGCYIFSPEKLVATIGIEDLIIVNTDDALLICRKGRSQDVKEISDYLRRKQMNEYL
ncbi:MAG: mannose-1-phosphate guanylyltransferase, partial [Bacteroidetes bacterium]|nr:mannose-1-phosphate guanylyltransferase [Bacteroidota bacterium]